MNYDLECIDSLCYSSTVRLSDDQYGWRTVVEMVSFGSSVLIGFTFGASNLIGRSRSIFGENVALVCLRPK